MVLRDQIDAGGEVVIEEDAAAPVESLTGDCRLRRRRRDRREQRRSRQGRRSDVRANQSREANRTLDIDFTGALLECICARERLGGAEPPANLAEVARALNLMDEAYLLDAFGRESRVSTETAVRTLTEIWVAVIDHLPEG